MRRKSLRLGQRDRRRPDGSDGASIKRLYGKHPDEVGGAETATEPCSPTGWQHVIRSRAVVAGSLHTPGADENCAGGAVLVEMGRRIHDEVLGRETVDDRHSV